MTMVITWHTPSQFQSRQSISAIIVHQDSGNGSRWVIRPKGGWGWPPCRNIEGDDVLGATIDLLRLETRLIEGLFVYNGYG